MQHTQYLYFHHHAKGKAEGNHFKYSFRLEGKNEIRSDWQLYMTSKVSARLHHGPTTALRPAR